MMDGNPMNTNGEGKKNRKNIFFEQITLWVVLKRERGLCQIRLRVLGDFQTKGSKVELRL